MEIFVQRTLRKTPSGVKMCRSVEREHVLSCVRVVFAYVGVTRVTPARDRISKFSIVRPHVKRRRELVHVILSFRCSRSVRMLD